MSRKVHQREDTAKIFDKGFRGMAGKSVNPSQWNAEGVAVVKRMCLSGLGQMATGMSSPAAVLTLAHAGGEGLTKAW